MRLGAADHVFATGSKLSTLVIPGNGLHGVGVHPPIAQS